MDKVKSVTQRLSWRERFSYASLDFSGQLIFNVISAYLLYFFTDVAGIPVATAGVILLIARVFDGIDAPIWGSLIDITHTRWGKARPYFLWMATPFAVMGVLTFWAPQILLHQRIMYCAITYIITGISYTGINTPLTTVLPLLTPNSQERLTLNSIRLAGSNLGVLVTNVLTLPLVALLGGGNDIIGFRWTMIIFASLFWILTLIAFSNIKERVKPAQEKVSIKLSVKAIKGNWPWIIIVLSNLIFWVALTVRSSTIVYYLTYNYGDKGLVPLINGISFVQILAVLLIPVFSKKFSQRNIWLSGLFLGVLGQVVIWAGGKSLAIIIVGWIIGNLGSGIAVSLPFALLGSAVDYGEYKTGINAAGLLTAIGSSFCIKIGSGIGGALPAWIMGMFGYVANQQQTTHGLFGISLAFNGMTILMFLLAMVPLIFYGKYEKMQEGITKQLTNIHAKAAAAKKQAGEAKG